MVTKQTNRWSQEQLEHAFEVEARVGAPEYGATVHIIPIFAGGIGEGGYGAQIRWDVRMFRRGAMGPTKVDETNLMAVGCSEDEALKVMAAVDNACDFLKRAYPVLEIGIAQKVKALEAKVKVALPPGHEATREKFEV
ncbi:unnamed protein product [marine sediment metagenome]|uniref:Uncharacterized protein n=1 Tax=marine sediment metagenome TaxID=412755 RepID=X1UCH2_9ZZZZ